MSKCLKLFLITLFGLFLASSASAQGSLYRDVAWRYTPSGVFPATAAIVTVCTSAATGTPCTPTITVYSNSALSLPVANPLIACSTSGQVGCIDGLGNFSFYAAQGGYTYTVTGTGLTAYGPIPFGLSCVAGVTCVSTSANNNFTGANTFASINKVVYVDQANSQGWAGADYGAWVMSAIASLPLRTPTTYSMGMVVLAPSTSVVTQSSGVSISSPFLTVHGPGPGALQINCTFNGKCWDVDTDTFGIDPGVLVEGFSIVGNGASNANAVGLYTGDNVGGTFRDLTIDNFTGANSSCVWIDNIDGFTERNLFMHVITGLAQNGQNGCTKAWRWTNTGNIAATSSFSHNSYLADSFSVLDGQIAFSVEGGSAADINFDFTGNASTGTTATIFSLSGFSFGSTPQLFDGNINVSVECTTPCTTAKLTNIAANNNVFIRAGIGLYDVSALMTNTITGNVARVLNDTFNGTGVETTWLMGQSFSGPARAYIFNPANPAANRQITIVDPLGPDTLPWLNAAQTFTNKTLTAPVINGSTGAGTLRASLQIADQGTACTNGELALSAGWQSTGSATVTAVAGNGQTCSWTITTGTTTAANPTVTDTLTNALPSATTVCEMNIHGGTHTPAAGETFQQTALSATVPIFTFIGTPTAGGTTYLVTRRCGP